ncbi:class I adenylate-forming enzyme family protein [Sphaerisporangium rhizosphaerae]|uniref:Class I adenylate-forming enzyme family protein n=1 Tax=Sphaerisporangium rhizosphaerae TaxID=2269375 RepID=A0ABW2PCH6_9ACTN
MSTHSLYEAVREAGRPDDPAFLADHETHTYDELLRAAAEFAASLAAGPDPGEPLVCELSDRWGTAVVTLGCDLAEVPLVHRDPRSPGSIPGRLVHDGQARRPGHEETACLGGRLWLRHSRDGTPPPAGLPARSQTFLTSGSTGAPVGVVRTARAVLADALRVGGFLAYASDAPVVTSAPLFHAYGFNYGLLAPLLAGAAVRSCAAHVVPSQLVRAVRELGARTLIALPAHYGLLARSLEQGRDDLAAGLAGLRSGVSAGAPLAPGVAGSVARRCTFAFYNCYGSSEAGAVTLTRVTGTEDTGFIGEPLPGVEARVVPLDATSTAGELQLRTTSLAAGRLGAGGVEPLAAADGWYPTGDLAETVGPEGALRLVGRMSTVINIAGKKVTPEEIERVLTTHPDIVDVQVLAAPDEARGQVPVARIVLRNDITSDALVGWCRQRLAPYQIPRSFEPVKEIPRSATGKRLAQVDPAGLVTAEEQA